MKKMFSWLIGATIIAMPINACSDNDHSYSTPGNVLEAFQAQFPLATNVDWDMESGFYVAEFKINGLEHHVWYDDDAIWRMTETEIGLNMLAVPEAVQDAFLNSGYQEWFIEDIDKYQRPDDEFYLIEIEMMGQQDRNLFFAPDGKLLRDEVSKENVEVLPTIIF